MINCYAQIINVLILIYLRTYILLIKSISLNRAWFIYTNIKQLINVKWKQNLINLYSDILCAKSAT